VSQVGCTQASLAGWILDSRSNNAINSDGRWAKADR
jgi:hypothetical protein